MTPLRGQGKGLGYPGAWPRRSHSLATRRAGENHAVGDVSGGLAQDAHTMGFVQTRPFPCSSGERGALGGLPVAKGAGTRSPRAQAPGPHCGKGLMGGKGLRVHRFGKGRRWFGPHPYRKRHGPCSLRFVRRSAPAERARARRRKNSRRREGAQVQGQPAFGPRTSEKKGGVGKDTPLPKSPARVYLGGCVKPLPCLLDVYLFIMSSVTTPTHTQHSNTRA